MSGDYISKAVAINKIMEYIVHQDSHDIKLHNRGLMKAMSVIDSIPAADVVEVRHGQWKGVATGWECSVCTIVSNNTYPHCPYCGAVMYGGQDE